MPAFETFTRKLRREFEKCCEKRPFVFPFFAHARNASPIQILSVATVKWFRVGQACAEFDDLSLKWIEKMLRCRCRPLFGAPMRPDEIEELMYQMNQPKMAHVLPTEGEEGDDPPE